MKYLPHFFLLFLHTYLLAARLNKTIPYITIYILDTYKHFQCSDWMASILLEPKRKTRHGFLTLVSCNFSFNQRAFQTAAHNHENKPAPDRQHRRKIQATPVFDSKTWFPVCHLFCQPSYVWLNWWNLYIDNSGALFLETFQTNDL